MFWNWQLPDWPKFYYHPEFLVQAERQFFVALGSTLTYMQSINHEDRQQIKIEILTSEGEKSSLIEGVTLDRESLQSSLKRHFGLKAQVKPSHFKEKGMAEVICSVFDNFHQPLTHQMLFEWHKKIFLEESRDFNLGEYRTHKEPMQIVSNRLGKPQLFFEAPPSKIVMSEMDRFLKWFNSHDPSQSILGKAAIAHLYFENIHPFKDGNGRIGRAIIEKSLSQGIGQPILIAVSKIFEKRKKEYYNALQASNRTLEATIWVEFFAEAVLQAQQESLTLLKFVVQKFNLLNKLTGKINSRQEKALLRMFQEGPSGFQGGLSAEKYIAITGASRATATRDLSDLTALGALIKTGELRHTRYWLNLS